MWVGGILMSTIATSGRSPRHEREELVRRPRPGRPPRRRRRRGAGRVPRAGAPRPRRSRPAWDLRDEPDPARRRLRTVSIPSSGADAVAQVHDHVGHDRRGVDGERKEPARFHGLDPDRPSRGFDNVADDGVRRLPNRRDRVGPRRSARPPWPPSHPRPGLRSRPQGPRRQERSGRSRGPRRAARRSRGPAPRVASPTRADDRSDIPVPSPVSSRSPIEIAINCC